MQPACLAPRSLAAEAARVLEPAAHRPSGSGMVRGTADLGPEATEAPPLLFVRLGLRPL